jgi:hypothetical protein
MEFHVNRGKDVQPQRKWAVAMEDVSGSPIKPDSKTNT